RTLSSDPYLLLTLSVPVPRKDDQEIHFRTPTHHKTLNPKFPPHTFWRVSNILATGFHLKIVCKDEDPNDQDDGLGQRKLVFDRIDDGWKREHMRIELHRHGGGSWRAFACALILSHLSEKRVGRGRPIVEMSIECVGETKDKGGRTYEPFTSGPCK